MKTIKEIIENYKTEDEVTKQIIELLKDETQFLEYYADVKHQTDYYAMISDVIRAYKKLIDKVNISIEKMEKEINEQLNDYIDEDDEDTKDYNPTSIEFDFEKIRIEDVGYYGHKRLLKYFDVIALPNGTAYIMEDVELV